MKPEEGDIHLSFSEGSLTFVEQVRQGFKIIECEVGWVVEQVNVTITEIVRLDERPGISFDFCPWYNFPLIRGALRQPWVKMSLNLYHGVGDIEEQTIEHSEHRP
jgi:hypothetical protein